MKKPIVAHSFEEMNKLDTELVNDIPLQKRKAAWKAITELFADYEQKCGPLNAYYFSGRQVKIFLNKETNGIIEQGRSKGVIRQIM